MKNRDARYIIRLYFKKLEKYAGQVKRNFSEESIHLFRINVKKLRAFLRMMRLEAKDPGALKFPPHFKKIYSYMGNIRDRQLYLGYIKKNSLFKEVPVLEKEIEELKKEKEIFISKKEFNDIEEKIKESLPHHEDPELPGKFFLQKINSIRSILAKEGYADKELHSIRKNIKDIIYIITIYKVDLKKPFPFWQEIQLEKAENFSHLLGLFNDTCIRLSFIKTGNSKKTSEKEKQQFSFVRLGLLAEKRRLKKEIKDELSSISGYFDISS